MNNKFSVFWDWNGTIVNDSWLFVDLMNVFLKEKKLPDIDVKKYREKFVFPVVEYYRRLGFDFSKESFESLGFRFIEDYKKNRFKAGLFLGIVDVLKLLHDFGVKQFVVSAQEHSLLLSAIKHYNLDRFFIGSSGVKNIYAKGKSSIALELKKKFLSDENNKLFVVGDSLYDAQVAYDIGATPILVSYGHYAKHRLDKKNHIIVDSVADLKLFFLNQIKEVN